MKKPLRKKKKKSNRQQGMVVRSELEFPKSLPSYPRNKSVLLSSPFSFVASDSKLMDE